MYNIERFILEKLMKALAVGLLALGVSAPAFAGPYVSSKVAAKGENSDYEKTEVEVRLGYETKTGNLKPYIEIGPNWEMKDGEDDADFLKAVEFGTKIKLSDNLGSKVKAEFVFDDDGDVEWKYEAGLTYDL